MELAVTVCRRPKEPPPFELIRYSVVNYDIENIAALEQKICPLFISRAFQPNGNFNENFKQLFAAQIRN